jgi:hypothetical protein
MAKQGCAEARDRKPVFARTTRKAGLPMWQSGRQPGSHWEVAAIGRKNMDTTDAILEQLRLLDAKPDAPISLFEIGVPLTSAGHTQDAIVNGLFYLQGLKKIELLPGNRVRVVTSLCNAIKKSLSHCFKTLLRHKIGYGTIAS